MSTVGQNCTSFSRRTRSVHRLPAPRISAHAIEVVFRNPAEYVFGLLWVGIVFRNIARTARLNINGKLTAACAAERRHHIKHTRAFTGAEVHDLNARLAIHPVERRDMAACQVNHVDVIAHTRAIGRGVVVAEHANGLHFANRDLCDIRHEVIRNALRVFADKALSCAPMGLK